MSSSACIYQRLQENAPEQRDCNAAAVGLLVCRTDTQNRFQEYTLDGAKVFFSHISAERYQAIKQAEEGPGSCFSWVVVEVFFGDSYSM